MLPVLCIVAGALVLLLWKSNRSGTRPESNPFGGGHNRENVAVSLPKQPHGQRLSITSSPADVAVFLDGTPVGTTTPLELTDLRPGVTCDLRLEKEGYLPWSQRVFLPEDAVTPVTVHAELSPKPGTLTLAFVPSPAHLLWEGIDRIVTSPLVLKDIVPHQAYWLRLEAPGCHPEERRIVMNPGEERILNLDMKPLAALLTITSDPEGASLVIDGTNQGRQTPIYSLQLMPGKAYRIVLERPGYQPWETRYEAEAHSNEALHATLVPLKGGLRVACTPQSDVYLNGERLGRTPFFSADIPAGRHILQLRNPQRKLLYQESVWIPRDIVVKKTYAFEGTLDLSGIQRGIEVLLNGNLIGRTPLASRKLPVGTYELTLRDPRSKTGRTLFVDILQDRRSYVQPR